MKITVKQRTANDNNDYRAAYAIDMNGENLFRVSDGEPEDANLGRDFNDVYNIPVMLAKAYEAGKANTGLAVVVEDLE